MSTPPPLVVQYAETIVEIEAIKAELEQFTADLRAQHPWLPEG